MITDNCRPDVSVDHGRLLVECHIENRKESPNAVLICDVNEQGE